MPEYTDRELIIEFDALIEKMKANSLIQNGKLQKIHVNHGFNEQGPFFRILDSQNEPMDLEKFDSLTMAFRQTVMPSEPVNLSNVLSILIKYAPSEKRDNLERFKTNWEAKLASNSRLIESDNKQYSIITVLRMQLYGGMFHTDKAKRQFVKNWGNMLKGEFVLIVHELSAWVFKVGITAKRALEEQWITP